MLFGKEKKKRKVMFVKLDVKFVDFDYSKYVGNSNQFI